MHLALSKLHFASRLTTSGIMNPFFLSFSWSLKSINGTPTNNLDLKEKMKKKLQKECALMLVFACIISYLNNSKLNMNYNLHIFNCFRYFTIFLCQSLVFSN